MVQYSSSATIRAARCSPDRRNNPCGRPAGQRADLARNTGRLTPMTPPGELVGEEDRHHPWIGSDHLGPQSSRCMTLAFLPWPWTWSSPRPPRRPAGCGRFVGSLPAAAADGDTPTRGSCSCCAASRASARSVASSGHLLVVLSRLLLMAMAAAAP